MKEILMVDDQVESLDLVSHLLEGEYNVFSAKTIAKAFSLLRSNTFDLILLDVLMPGMSGIEFFQYIQKEEYPSKKTPVIFVSSESDVAVVCQAVKLGAAGYIIKPINAEDLIKKIQAVIGK